MVNMMKLMKQAATMQKSMEQLQGALAQREYEFSSGGGMVTAIVKGNMTLERIKIDPKVIDASEADMLEDLLQAAVNGALTKARESAAEEMSKITGGLGIPGM